MEEQLFVVRKCDVHYRRILADLPKPLPNHDSYFKGILGREMWQYKGLFLGRNFGKLSW